jgi:hypothetical protein
MERICIKHAEIGVIICKILGLDFLNRIRQESSVHHFIPYKLFMAVNINIVQRTRKMNIFNCEIDCHVLWALFVGTLPLAATKLSTGKIYEDIFLFRTKFRKLRNNSCCCSYMFKVPQCPFSKLLSPTTLDENCCPSILLMEIMELLHPPPSLYIKLTVLVSIHHLHEQRSNQKSL